MQKRRLNLIDKIRQITANNEQLSILDMSKTLKTSESTIRRCLKILENKGEIIRNYGGARRIPVVQEQIFSKKYLTNASEKDSIAMHAASFIRNGDIILLDGSSTITYMSKYLQGKKEITLLTTGFPIVKDFVLSQKEHIQNENRLFILSGQLRMDSLAIVEIFSHNSLENYRVNKLFFSAVGVDLEAGITVSDANDAIQTQKMLEVADENFLVVDSSKFNQKSFCIVASLVEVNYLITDSGADEELLTRFLDKYPSLKIIVV